MHELVAGFANAVQLRQPCGRDRVGERGQVAANEDHIDAHSRVTDGVNLTLHEDPVRGVFCVWPEICHDQNIRFGISYFEGDELSIAFRRWTRALCRRLHLPNQRSARRRWNAGTCDSWG